MGGLVEDLLLLAELDRGRPLRSEPVDLHRVCTNAVDDSDTVPHDHHLVLEPGPPVVVVGDSERLAQVAHNLVRNALADTPPGTEVTVSTGVNGTMGFIRVLQTPAGEFRRPRPAGSSTGSTRVILPVPPRSGTGLGLAIVRPIAEGPHGTAAVATSPQGGSAILVTIPLAATYVAAPLVPLRRPRRSPQPHRGSGHDRIEPGGQLHVGLGGLGIGIRAGEDAPAGRNRMVFPLAPVARCGDRSSIAVSSGSDPPDLPGPVAPFARLVARHAGQGLGPRRSAHGRRWMERPQQVQHPRGPAQPALQPRPEAGHGREGHHGGLGRDRQVRQKGARAAAMASPTCGARPGSRPTWPGRAGCRRRSGRCRPGAWCRPGDGSTPGSVPRHEVLGLAPKRCRRGRAWRRSCNWAPWPAACAGRPTGTRPR